MSIKVVQSSLARHVKSMGISLVDAEAQTRVLSWIQKLSATSNTFADINAVLFDSHSTAIAEKLIEGKAKGLTLVEGSQNNAQRQKEFVANLLESSQDSELNTIVSALHAGISNVLSPSKLHPVSPSFWKKLQAPAEPPKKFHRYENPMTRVTSVFFGSMPFPTQQRAMLASLLQQRILHLATKGVPGKSTAWKKGAAKEGSSYFDAGPFTLITFLHASQLARLLSCPRTTSEYLNIDLSFYSATHKKFSESFHDFFSVTLPADFEGIPLEAFHPFCPKTPFTSYGKKLIQAGFDDEHLYAVQIEPRETVEAAVLETIVKPNGENLNGSEEIVD